MEKETILIIIERMREKGCIKHPTISAYFNMLLGAEKISKAYELLSKDNIEIILRSIIKQYVKMHSCNRELLNLEVFEKIVKEKNLKDEMIVKLFKACMQKNKYEEHVKACKTFIHTCDLLFSYKTES